MKKIWAVRKDSEAVSPVIATILMVAITVVLAAVLYVMVLGFGTDTTQTPTTTVSKTSITNGWRLTIGSLTDDVSWDAIDVLMSDGTNTVTCTNVTAAALTGTSGAVLKNFGAYTLGTLSVTVKIMDLTGNGKVNQGDYIELTASSFSSTTDYEVRLMHTPTSAPMATTTFSG